MSRSRSAASLDSSVEDSNSNLDTAADEAPNKQSARKVEEERKVAHCITGAVRTLTEPRVYMSIKDNLIDGDHLKRAWQSSFMDHG